MFARPGTVVAAASVGNDKANPGSESPPLPALHSWSVTSAGQQYDALTLAADVVAAWKLWLEREGLSP